MATHGYLSALYLLPLIASPALAATASLFPFETKSYSEPDLAQLNHAGGNINFTSLLKFADPYATVNLSTCKVFPGDSAWPSADTWEKFDDFLDGALIKTRPSAASCYKSWPQYDAAQCGNVQSEWNISYFHAADPTSNMSPLFQGRTCLPTSASNGSCTLGGYPSYVVNASSVTHIQAAVNFARNQELRLVVKNTGHDFNGKSVGAGALSIWTHNLKDVAFYPAYDSTEYQGPALKIAAGVQAFEYYAAADKYGVTVVGGEGKTVGITGGYIAGGGHSPLSSLYGLAADQVISLEVVTAFGRFVTASATKNPDLYWALRGGGGSTFGVVTSLTVKAYPKIPVTTSSFSFGTSANVTSDKFWLGVRYFFTQFPKYVDAGTYAYFWILPTGPDSFVFNMVPFFAPNHTVDSFNNLTAPWFSQLASLGISITPDTTYHSDFYSAWNSVFPLETVGYDNVRSGSRLFPRKNFVDADKFNATFSAIKNTTESGHTLIAFSIGAPHLESNALDAANPAWRETVLHAITATTWAEDATHAEIKAKTEELTFDIIEQWRRTCPDAGAYMSEADVKEPNFQQAFYGSNYARLAEIKKKLDPWGLFYAPTAVGSEGWKIEGGEQLDGQDGRLCQV